MSHLARISHPGHDVRRGRAADPTGKAPKAMPAHRRGVLTPQPAAWRQSCGQHRAHRCQNETGGLAKRAAVLIGAALALLCSAMTGVAKDRHAGYYYPKPHSQENYKARSRVLPDADKRARINFVSAITNKMIQANYLPPYAIFAKGADAEKLIIVAVSDNAFNTLYRGRALFAMLSAQARTTPIFRRHGVETLFTFFDLANMMGFKQITVSDGRTYAHQVFLK